MTNNDEYSFIYYLRLIKQFLIRASSKNDREEGTNNMTSKWSEVGDDILCLILQRLHPFDYLRAPSVCLSWQSTISRLTTYKHNGLPLQHPLLLLQTDRTENNFSFFNFSTRCDSSADDSPSCSSSSTSLSFENHISCRGVVQGWMIMTEKCCFGTRVFFLNPVTKTKVYMRSRLSSDGSDIQQVIASTKPTDPNCIVVCLPKTTKPTDPKCIVFSHMCDKSWTKVIMEGDERRINLFGAQILGGKLYAVDDRIVVFDLTKNPVKPQILAKLPAIGRPSATSELINIHPRIQIPVIKIHGHVYESLAIDASSQELLLVRSIFNVTCSYTFSHVCPPDMTEIKVFKLDNILSGEPKWTELRNLENRILYVEHTRTSLLSSVDFHGPKEFEGNCIYFAHRFPFLRLGRTWNGLSIGRYSISDGTRSYYNFGGLGLVNATNPIWFMPHLDA